MTTDKSPDLELNLPPGVKLITVTMGGIGVEGALGAVELIQLDRPHTILPTDAEDITAILQPRIGSINLRILKPFYENPNAEMTIRQSAELAGIQWEGERVKGLWKESKKRLNDTPFRGWVHNNDEKPDAATNSWRIPGAVASVPPLPEDTIRKVVDAHLSLEGPFPILPYDQYHRTVVGNTLAEGLERYQASKKTETLLRLAGVKMTYLEPLRK